MMEFSKTQEFYDLMTTFENTHKHLRLDREKRGDTPAGYWYQSGETNDIFKEYLNGYMTGRAVYIGRTDEAKADAALGRAVRAMPVEAYLLRVAGGWQADAGIVPDISEGDTLEDALRHAGLMEAEK